MTRRATWIIPVAALAITTGWLISLSTAEPRRARRSDKERAERAERAERERGRDERDRDHEIRRRTREIAEQELGLRELRIHLQMLERMKALTFAPENCAMIAIGAIKDELDLEPRDAIKHLERLLAKTRSLGLRNAVRMSLKELYVQTHQTEKLLDLLMDLIAENDRAILEGDTPEREEADEEEEEEDDDD